MVHEWELALLTPESESLPKVIEDEWADPETIADYIVDEELDYPLDQF